ncbi:MAG: aldehyde dehydrogenase family protein [Actinomycetales bacterium]
MIRSHNPHDPSDLVVECPATSAADVASAVQAARAAHFDWAGAPAAIRASALAAAAALLSEHADEFVTLMVREVGKPVTEARGELARSVAILSYYAQQVYDPVGSVLEPSLGGMLYTHRRPHGVAGLITPWNFPLAIPLWKAAPALVFGNTVALKPAPEATACALRLAELLAEVLPDGVLWVLPGDAPTGRALLQAVDVVSFTGSTTVGRQVAAEAAQRGIPVQAEMGGQNPAIILPDADLTSAVNQIAAAAMGFAGQKCTATKRVIVVGDATAARETLVEAIGALPTGDPAEPECVVGPLIDAAARDRVEEAAADALAAGARLLTGGSLETDGWYCRPYVVDHLPAGHRLARTEVFGPIVTLSAVDSLQEAIWHANDVDQGLVAALYTTDLQAALSATPALAAGLVKVNAPTTGVDFHAPFGGVKDSSIGGREQGKAAQDFYTTVHTISLALPTAGRPRLTSRPS